MTAVRSRPPRAADAAAAVRYYGALPSTHDGVWTTMVAAVSVVMMSIMSNDGHGSEHNMSRRPMDKILSTDDPNGQHPRVSGEVFP